MSENLTMRLLWAVLVGGAFGWVAAYGNAQMKKPGTQLGSRPRYGSMAYGIILPIAVLAYAVIEFIVFRGNLELAVQATVSFCFGIFLHISLYFLLLMLALPFLRKRTSALACALLWMVPNYLYFISNMELSSPLFVFRVPGRLIWVLAVVWLAGFAGVFLFKVVSHLRFRAWLLKGVRDPLPRTMDVWYEELNRANIVNPKFCLGIAPNVKTPLTVGLIPCADGGTTIAQWQPGEILFDHAVFQARLAMRTSRLGAILWHQGESDCLVPEQLEAYPEQFLRTMEGFRAQLGDLPILVGELGYPEHGFTGTPAPLLREFNRRLPDLAARIPGCRVISAQGLTCRGDGLHFDTPSLRTFGLRYLEGYQALAAR